MDQFDLASEFEQLAREAALRQRKPVTKHNGHCLNCGEAARGAFCNPECREDYERIERAAKRSGLQKIEEEE